MGATPTGPTLDPLNILVNKFNIATHVALILFLFSSWINYLLYDTKSVMVFWQLLSKIKRFVTIFRISWNGPTLFNIPIGDFPPIVSKIVSYVRILYRIFNFTWNITYFVKAGNISSVNCFLVLFNPIKYELLSKRLMTIKIKTLSDPIGPFTTSYFLQTLWKHPVQTMSTLLRRNCTSDQNWACFVHLKISKIIQTSWRKWSQKLQNGITISKGQLVLELFFKTCKV